MYETIVFDLDGTLLDTLDDLTAAVNVAMRAVSLPMRTREEVRAFIGNGIVKLIERACGEEHAECQDTALQTFKTYYAAHCQDLTKPYDGVMELLQRLRECGIKTAIVSNKADFAVKILAKNYFGDLILFSVGEKESKGIRKKPAPDSLLAVLQGLGTKKENALYVGDSEVDIQTARNAGVACLSVSWGFKGRTFLEANGAKCIVDAPMDIWAYIEGIL